MSVGSPLLGLYVHLPFCTTKCGYCDFYSLPTRSEMVPDLARAILAELAARDPQRPFQTVFVGGGTPTVLPAEFLDMILGRIAERLVDQGRRDVEFTCEANPSTADELKLDLLRRRGVNRVSFGAQSFDPAELVVLERLHDPSHIAEAVRGARAAGFENVNLDLIYGIPGQTMASWRNSLRRAIDLGPDHLSCYGLMYEVGTAMTKRLKLGQVTPCEDELEADMFEATIDELAAAGYEQYEISNFARPGRRCRHNLIYWRNEEYLGVGPSAVSYLDGWRTRNRADVHAYVEAFARPTALPQPIVVERECLPAEPRARETAVQMLRLTEGIDAERFRRSTGFDPSALFRTAIEKHRRTGLLAADNGAIRLTRRGQLLANRVMMDFV